MARGLQITRIAIELGVDAELIPALYDYLKDPDNEKRQREAEEAIGQYVMSRALKRYQEVKKLARHL